MQVFNLAIGLNSCVYNISSYIASKYIYVEVLCLPTKINQNVCLTHEQFSLKNFSQIMVRSYTNNYDYN